MNTCNESLEQWRRRYARILGQCVQRRRKALRLTQVQLAHQSKLARSEVQFIEGGNRRPKQETLEMLCSGLGGIMTEELTLEVRRLMAV